MVPVSSVELESLAVACGALVDERQPAEAPRVVDSGNVRVADTLLSPAELGYVHPGIDTLTLVNESDGPARTILLGGTPFEEEIVMWWNFIGRDHEDIVRAREDWEASSERFGGIEEYPGGRLAAPALPNAVIRPRANPPRR